MSRSFLFHLKIAILLSVFACKQDAPPPAAAPAPVKRASWKGYGCELVTDAEVVKMFAFDPAAATLNARTLPDQIFCLRTWNKPDWKERENSNEKEGATWLNPQNRLVVRLLDYGSDEHARVQLATLRRDRRSTYEEDVVGIGDDAVWSTSTVTLLAKKSQFMLYITLEHTDQSHDNLLKAKEIAALALAKL
jgi:hypothetical protein